MALLELYFSIRETNMDQNGPFKFGLKRSILARLGQPTALRAATPDFLRIPQKEVGKRSSIPIPFFHFQDSFGRFLVTFF